MLNFKTITGGFLGGVLGGAAVDLIFIDRAGPSGLFTLMGITDRLSVFLGHVILGAIMGIVFVFLLKLFPKINIWLSGILWGLILLLVIGAIPSFFAGGIINAKTTFFGFLVWIIYGFILSATVKFFGKNGD